MDKIIKLVFNTSPKKRGQVRSNCELYSHDINNNWFEIRINNLSLTTESVIATFKFVKSNKYWETTGIIENNIIKIKFDTSLITQDEQVNCYLLLKDSEKRSDIYAFNFDVKMSEYDLKDNLPIKERYFSNSVVVDRLDVLTKEDLKKQAERIDALETKADKDTVYDDSDLQKRVKAIEDKPEVDISKLATKEAVDDVAAKVTQLEARPVTASYDDSEIKKKIKELEDRPAGSGGNIDTNNFVTQKEFGYYKTYSTLVNDMSLYDYFQQPSVAKEPNKDGVIGCIFSQGGPVVFKGERDEELEYIYFQQLMTALIDVLPHDYIHNSDQKTTFLTDKNFKEMVATPEFKAVVKESLREIVKEIISENN